MIGRRAFLSLLGLGPVAAKAGPAAPLRGDGRSAIRAAVAHAMERPGGVGQLDFAGITTPPLSSDIRRLLDRELDRSAALTADLAQSCLSSEAAAAKSATVSNSTSDAPRRINPSSISAKAARSAPADTAPDATSCVTSAMFRTRRALSSRCIRKRCSPFFRVTGSSIDGAGNDV